MSKVRLTGAAAIAAVAILMAACTPAPPQVYHYNETGVLRGYNIRTGEMRLHGTMLTSMRLSEPARCYDTSNKIMECRLLANHIGKKVEIKWHGNPETGVHTVGRVQVVK